MSNIIAELDAENMKPDVPAFSPGDIVVVGAPADDDVGADFGSAYVFARNTAGVWSEVQKLTASDGAAEDFFGISVAVDNGTILIGSSEDDDNGIDSGSAYVFTTDSGGVWSEVQKLVAGDGAAGDFFGSAVGLDTYTAVIGAFADDDNGLDSGSAYVFARNTGGSWSQQDKLVGSGGVAGENFGVTVAVDRGIALAGTPLDSSFALDMGSTYVFTRSSGGLWNELQEIEAGDSVADDQFGFSVAVDSGNAVIGSINDDNIGSNAGSAYVFSVGPTPLTFLASVPDINANGFAEVAVVVEGGSNHVHIRDGNTGALISDIDFGTDPVSGMVVIDDVSGNAAPEIAVLGTRPDNNVRVQVRDSVTGAILNSVFYGVAYSASDIAVLPDTDGNGAAELMVVGANAPGGVRAQARDAVTDAQTSTTFYGSKVPPQDVLTLPDVSGNGEPEVLMHGRVTVNSQGRAQMRDTSSKALVRNLFFGTAYAPVELAVIEDLSGDGVPDIAQLGRRGDSGAVRVQVKRTDTGATISNAFIGNVDIPISLVGIGDANGNSAPDVAVLVQRPDGTAKVILRDGATGAFIRNIFAGAVSNPVAMTLIDDLDLSGGPELVILGDDGAGNRRVQIRDSLLGSQVATINFP